MKRQIDGALLASFVTNLGAAIPIALLEENHKFANANAWDFAASCVFGLSALALLGLYLFDLHRPYVEWTLRIAGGTWLAYGIAIACVGTYAVESRSAFAMIFTGIAIGHLVLADRLEGRLGP